MYASLCMSICMNYSANQARNKAEMTYSRVLFATLLALAVSGVQSQYNYTTIFSTSWEQGAANGAWSSLIRNWGCPCPAANFDFSSALAARTGSRGVAITITTPSTDGWHVQLQSPLFNLSSAQIYDGCFWVRTTIAGGAQVPMNLLLQSGFQWITGSSVAATSSWQQVCIRNFLPPSAAPAAYYFTLDLGLLKGAVHVDDFSLAARRNSAAEDEAYVNATNTAARINAHRKGNFTLKFVNKTTNTVLGGTKLASLKLRLAVHDFPFGSAMEWSGVPSNRISWYNATAKKHFNTLVPEWSYKWPSYEPVKGQYQSSYNYIMNNHVNFATANDFVLARGHTLEWLTAAWGFPQHWSRKDGCDAYRTYLQTRITRDVSAFKGKFQQYDVFNEILHELNFVENCPGMWPGILYDGFRWAAAADPTAQLCLNDYDLITGDGYWPLMVQLVKDMKAAGVPIHCIGVQAYQSTQSLRKPAYLRSRLEALAALNLSIIITEYNFWSSWTNGVPVWSGTEAEHAELHDQFVRFWFSLPYVKGILMWGFWDSSNWITNGGIYYPNTTAKASATKLASLWGTTWNTTVDGTNVVLPSTALYGPYNGFYGKYYYEATIGQKKYTGFVKFPSSAGPTQTASVLL